MPNVMIDLETTGQAAGCAILSIGAVMFTKDSCGPTFYSAVRAGSGQLAGLRDDPNTIEWWSRQSPEARKVWDEIKTAATLASVLSTFNDWIRTSSGVIYPWSKGASFDLPILAAAYTAVELPIPWKFWNEGCYRTIERIGKAHRVPLPDRAGTAHNAVDDARHQAECMQKIVRELRWNIL